MSDRDALIAAILAQPDEDTPRLMFADWLDEHGDSPRAEFIRVQCALAREFEAEADLPDNFGTGNSTGGCEWPMSWRPHDTEERLNLLRRESDLLNAHAAEWRKGLPKYADNAHNKQCLKFRRGFVGRVCVSLGPFMKSPSDLWRNHSVESLMLMNCAGAARLKIPKCRYLAALRELRFIESEITADMLAPVADCPHLSGLRELSFGASGVQESAAKELARSPYLKPTSLSVTGWQLGELGFGALVNGPFASRLRHLWAAGTCAIPTAALIASAPLTELRRLELRGGSGGDEGVRLLTLSAHLTRLVTLELGNNQLTNAALGHLAAWPGLASVRALNVGDNKSVTSRGLVALLKSPHFQPAYLGLRYSAVDDAGAKALAAWPGLANVIDLDLSYACLDDPGLVALADSPHWRDIRYLKINGNRLTGSSATRIRNRLGATKVDIWG